ncbi:MAG: sigma-70 family RNA polymerase sigma factor [Verrucomicrobia bacterium]|nr:sigma-70 family RNA polymerase sigma factor [Verrucomicrobiota bacterium]
MPAMPDLERLYDEHAPALFGFVLNLTRDDADARDILQECFQKIAAHPRRLDGVRDERAFLLRLAHNATIDLIRRRDSRERRHEAAGAELAGLFAPTADPDEAAFRSAVEDALAELPPEQRAVVHLKLWEGLTFDAIAELLDIPPSTAASRHRYGLDKMRDRLRPLYDELK